MRVCSICDRISGDERDHLDCIEMRRVRLEDEDLKRGVPERLGASRSSELAAEIRAVMDHMAREGG